MHETPEDLQHRQTVSEKLSANGRRFFQYIEFDANELLVAEIRKHPFGLLLILLTGGFVMLAIVAIAITASAVNLNETFGVEGLNSFRPILVGLGFFTIIGVAIMTYIGTFLYTNNVIYITSEKIAQVLYVSLFNRKISQLSIGDVQDVTVTQKGILAHLLNYGTLVIETAGEQQNYTFTFVPDPYVNSKLIVSAHEKNLATHGN